MCRFDPQLLTALCIGEIQALLCTTCVKFPKRTQTSPLWIDKKEICLKVLWAEEEQEGGRGGGTKEQWRRGWGRTYQMTGLPPAGGDLPHFSLHSALIRACRCQWLSDWHQHLFRSEDRQQKTSTDWFWPSPTNIGVTTWAKNTGPCYGKPSKNTDSNVFLFLWCNYQTCL